MLWPNSQSQSQSQSQNPTQPETCQTNPGDSLASNSTASTVLEQPTFTRTFPTNTLSQSQSLSTESSSVINFPAFHFSLRTLTPLRVALTPAGRGSVRVTLLVAVFEVDGPDPITTKNGQETHLLRLVIGEDDGSVGKLVAWRDTALEWGGARRMPGLRRGDVVLLSDVQVTSAPPDAPTLSASSRYNSGIQLCYRTVPRTEEDKRLRPDLRLGQTDACRYVSGKDLVHFLDGCPENKRGTATKSIYADVDKALSLLYANDLVFGDLQPPNVLVVKRKMGTGAMLIDFDWCPKAQEGHYPLGLNDSMLNTWATGMERGGTMEKTHDRGMIELLFK
ncbi:hypothetical protein FRC10_000017 [Ceratobasidium sp. 414]|nr:hypothetical protein FRC10_000017 [Ceratobasidium sp. 414]